MELDDCIEELLDAGLSERSAETAGRWAHSAIREARAEAASDAAVRLLGILFDGKRDEVRRRAVGMVFAINRPDLAGYLSLDQAAVGEGCSHTQVANWRNQMGKALGVPQ
jgi:hypothetical protein